MTGAQEKEVTWLRTRVLKLEAEQTRVKTILARFAAEPLSIASVQPLLDLNAELNGGAR